MSTLSDALPRRVDDVSLFGTNFLLRLAEPLAPRPRESSSALVQHTFHMTHHF